MFFINERGMTIIREKAIKTDLSTRRVSAGESPDAGMYWRTNWAVESPIITRNALRLPKESKIMTIVVIIAGILQAKNKKTMLIRQIHHNASPNCFKRTALEWPVLWMGKIAHSRDHWIPTAA